MKSILLLPEYQSSLEEGAIRYGYPIGRFQRALEWAVWAGELDALHELAPCRCCCGEHTFERCPARVWASCRGQGSFTRADEEAWAAHYARFHGMTREQFFA